MARTGTWISVYFCSPAMIAIGIAGPGPCLGGRAGIEAICFCVSCTSFSSCDMLVCRSFRNCFLPLTSPERNCSSFFFTSMESICILPWAWS